MLIGLGLSCQPVVADDVPPEASPPIPALPPLPFIDCKSLTEPGQDEEPTKGEKPVENEHGDPKCLRFGAPIPGGSGSGGSGDGGGGSSGVRNIPIRDTEIQSNCSMPDTKAAYAAAQLAPFRFSLRIGDRIRINYSNGESEIFVIVNSPTSSLPAAPVAGTCE